ncbi:hypothetical protein AL710_00205 [Clostridium botulinum]|uniref:hypothetical protein n=1 Tax=Clostridium botulinum TaxID=1491 RepID=UPI00099BF3B7|nr:hypothetical protein [Clostridium botulinum]OPD26426.1 hypothetical protein AL710_00205 [Clostridium botulinum]
MNNIKIGKNAIENLTIGMYEDSKIIYREYIQNAADQIDLAINKNYFDEKLEIDIQIDIAERKVIIMDNATGIPKDRVASTLADVADSEKDRVSAKGFRGIGRLGGLAYCNKLRFVTSYQGEKEKTIMTWDAKELIRSINDKTVKDDAGTLLDKIISYEYEECEEEEHFFRVELLGIKEENSELLNVEKVRDYIGENAPVTYSSKLIYKNKIYDYMKNRSLPKNEYKIFVNGQDINKFYTVSLYDLVQSGNKTSKNKYDEIYDIKIEEFKNERGELLAWMWYGISSFVKRIPSKPNPMAGIRLRKSNIQIGDSNTLVPLFKEERGNYYFIGEVHAVHPDLIPNARRDYFNENKAKNELEAHLKLYFDENLKRMYRYANEAKSSYKKNIELIEKEKNYENKNGKFVNDKEKEKMEHDIEEARLKDIKAQKDISKLENKAKNNNVLKIVLKHIKENYEEELRKKGLNKENNKKYIPKNKEDKVEKKDKENKRNRVNKPKKKKKTYLTDELSNLNSKERKLVSKIYGVINQNLPSQEGDALINKIQEELKR